MKEIERVREIEIEWGDKERGEWTRERVGERMREIEKVTYIYRERDGLHKESGWYIQNGR